MASRRTGRRAGWISTSSPSRGPARARRIAGRGPEGVFALKSLGQHFLIDDSVLRRIVDSLGAADGEAVIEVGPGLGALTALLLDATACVIAVEIDEALLRRLRSRFAAAANLTLVHADALQTSPAELLESAGLSASAPYCLAGNLPYNAGAAIVRHFLESEPRPRRLVVMLQREVAESMCARPGRMSLLSLATQLYASAQVLFDVPPQAFQPPPRVVSSVLRLETRPEPLVAAAERDWFFEVAHAGFSTPRKQLHNSLSRSLARPPAEIAAALRGAGVDPAARPQTLAVEDWLALSRALGERRGGD